jgi:hypothetical protein
MCPALNGQLESAWRGVVQQQEEVARSGVDALASMEEACTMLAGLEPLLPTLARGEHGTEVGDLLIGVSGVHAQLSTLGLQCKSMAHQNLCHIEYAAEGACVIGLHGQIFRSGHGSENDSLGPLRMHVVER